MKRLVLFVITVAAVAVVALWPATPAHAASCADAPNCFLFCWNQCRYLCGSSGNCEGTASCIDGECQCSIGCVGDGTCQADWECGRGLSGEQLCCNPILGVCEDCFLPVAEPGNPGQSPSVLAWLRSSDPMAVLRPAGAGNCGLSAD